MKIKLFSFLAICSLAFISCKKGALEIDGQISDAANLSIFFDAVSPVSNTNNVLLKTESDGAGKFNFSFEEMPAKGLYRVRVGAKSAFLILDGTEKQIKLSGTLENLSNFGYEISGSKFSEEYKAKIQAFIAGQLPPTAMSEYVQEQADPLISMLIATQVFGGSLEFAPLHQRVSARVSEAYPDLSSSIEYISFADGMQKEYLREQSSQKVQIGALAPDIELPDLKGKMRKLSELRGSIVLLDFWAAWCGPCRKENPNVVRIYDKYNKSGFTVFSVSLDGISNGEKERYPSDQYENLLRAQKERWQGAIQQDNLKWNNHVSDLKKWDSQAAAIYGVTSIPRTYLIDREGKIAFINPRRNLEEALQTLL